MIFICRFSLELHTNIFFPIEIIGTIAFASSGAMVAVRKKLDLFGIIVLGFAGHNIPQDTAADTGNDAEKNEQKMIFAVARFHAGIDARHGNMRRL